MSSGMANSIPVELMLLIAALLPLMMTTLHPSTTWLIDCHQKRVLTGAALNISLLSRLSRQRGNVKERNGERGQEVAWAYF